MRYAPKLPHRATYWPPLAPDAYGQRSFGAPVEFACRWETNLDELLKGADNKAGVKTVVYHVFPTETLGALRRGSLADAGLNLGDPFANGGAAEIRAVQADDAVGGGETFYTSVL